MPGRAAANVGEAQVDGERTIEDRKGDTGCRWTG